MPPETPVSIFTSICNIGWRPLLVTTLLLDWLRQHFSNESLIEDSDLAGTLWKADDTTNILIESITRWKPELTEKRPAVIVKRNDIQNHRIAIGDHALAKLGPEPDGSDIYATWFTGSHTLFCLGREGAEVEKLSTEVYRELLEFGPYIRNELDLNKFSIQQVGGLFKLDESKETFAVPVVVTWAWEEHWKLVPRAPLLKKIDLAIFQP